MTIISEFLVSFIRIILCLFFITKEKPCFKNLLISVAGAGLSCVALLFTDMPLLYVPLCEIIAVLLCLKLYGNTDRRKNLFFCIMYEIGTSLWVFIISEALAKLTGIAAFSRRENQGVPSVESEGSNHPPDGCI